MLWFAVEAFLNLILLALVGLFLRFYPHRDFLFFAVCGAGLFAAVLLFNSFRNKRVKPRVRVPKNTVNETKTSVSLKQNVTVKASLEKLDFVETSPATVLPETNYNPFQFVTKKTPAQGQSQLQPLDELVISLGGDFRHCLIVSDLRLNSGDGSLLEFLAEGRKIESLFCHGIYSRIDLIPDLGNLASASLLTKKICRVLLQDWMTRYDRIIFHMEESRLVEAQGLVAQIFAGASQSPSAQSPSAQSPSLDSSSSPISSVVDSSPKSFTISQ